MDKDMAPRIQKVAVLGNYLPRQCGIATYTADLCDALTDAFPAVNTFALAMNDSDEGYAYPERVRFELAQEDIITYHQAADMLNLGNVDAVSVQHEYGIFGGSSGSHVLALLRDVRAPIVTTLHTILQEPTPQQRRVLTELARLSSRLVVMSERGATFLREIYGVAARKIDVIPHGIPDLQFLDSSFNKDQFDAEGKTVILTFGLLSRNKGIEDVIAAIPAILEQHPNCVYIVLGSTHPHVRQHEGEQYRLMLQDMVHELGIEAHVVFQDQFVSHAELAKYIGATDIYITPYLNEAQIVSGTLAYTIGAGKAIISTPYWYAEEMLAEGCGVLVPFRDPAAIAAQVNALLDDEGERHAMRKRAYLRGRAMTWPQVAQRYMETFRQARDEYRDSPHAHHDATLVSASAAPLPALRLDHLQRMTDDTGLVQHAVFAVPNYNEGYTTDDNARALIAAVLLEEIGAPEATAFATRYIAFLWHAFCSETGRFRNFMGYDRRWLETSGSEDSHARALWALGTVLGRSRNPSLRGIAAMLFERSLPTALAFEHPRPWAFALLGADAYLKQFRGDRAAQAIRQQLGERLLARYQEQRSDTWHWFADTVTYDNAVLPHALLMSGSALDHEEMREAGLEALRWLAALQRAEEGHFAPVGSNGFYQRDITPARFDQQPLEAHAMATASLAAYRLTADDRWHEEARRAFDWFLGRNDLGLPLYDSSTGGCHDGLETDRVNQNQGAESTLAFLLTLLEFTLDAEQGEAILPALPADVAIGTPGPLVVCQVSRQKGERV